MTLSSIIPERLDVPADQTWDLSAIFKSVAEWQASLDEVLNRLPEIEAYRGRLVEGPATAVAYFETYETLARIAGKVFSYAMLESSADSNDQNAAARRDQAISMYARLDAASSFDDPEFIALGFDRLREWMQTHAGFKKYAHYFERLENQREFVKAGDVEQAIALAQDPLGAPRSIYSSLTNADMKFAPALDGEGNSHEVAQSTIDGLLTAQDRELRKNAWTNYADGYLAFKNTLSSTLMGAVKKDVFFVRARGYSSSLAASLSPNRIPESVFYNLIDVFKKNLPQWHRYWRIRKKALQYDRLKWYDTVAPLAQRPPVVTYRQAVDWISEGMRLLGGEYTEIMRNGCLEERWVDWSVNKGKRAGAFSNGSYDTFPYIMMSFNDNLLSLSTLAHELGHSMHSYYSRQNQPFFYAGYSLFVAEVASNFNQALTRAYLFESTSDREFHLSLIDETMSNFRRYFFIMPTLARFELELHERIEQGAPVSADVMNGLCADLFEEGFGDSLELDRQRMGITWAQFGHLYANFYVYQYATGIAGAHALAHQVLTDKSGGAAARYLEFLKTGGSKYPLDALKQAGVDLESSEPVEMAFETLSQVLDRLEDLVG